MILTPNADTAWRMAEVWPSADAGVAAMAPSVAASSSTLRMDGLFLSRLPLARLPKDRSIMDLLLASLRTGGDPGRVRLNGA
jgi:hypothetical protein